MTNYRRHYRPGGVYFFTLTLADRGCDSLTGHIGILRSSFLKERQLAPFSLQAWAVLPDHLHVLMRLPNGDTDFSNRLRRIKGNFSHQLPAAVKLSASMRSKGERGIWQRRFWEHAIRDEEDWQRHFDYIHHNPVKHGLVSRVCDWPHSSFHAYVERGVYPLYWGCEEALELMAGE